MINKMQPNNSAYTRHLDHKCDDKLHKARQNVLV
jgi:hypothetical protein